MIMYFSYIFSINELNELCHRLFESKKEVLKSYVNKLLNDKWPRPPPPPLPQQQQTQAADVSQLLKFMLTWPLFQTVYENHIQYWQVASSSPFSVGQNKTNYQEADCLLSFAWNEKYIEAFRYMIDMLNRLALGNADISDIVSGTLYFNPFVTKLLP